MPLIAFVDGLPYTYARERQASWMSNASVSALRPNVGYSSNLHWELFCGLYPDDLGFFTDWARKAESRLTVKAISHLLGPLDRIGDAGVVARKVFDKFVFREPALANIPSRFRKLFSNQASYLLASTPSASRIPHTQGYTFVLQDEGNVPFEENDRNLRCQIESEAVDVFTAFSFADAIGHRLGRGEAYDRELDLHMNALRRTFDRYLGINPEQEVLLISDHGMSTVHDQTDLSLESKFGRQSETRYIAYTDTAILRVFIHDEHLIDGMANYLSSRTDGHLLNDHERSQNGVVSRRHGDLIFVLNEGIVFGDNWFGKSLRRQKGRPYGMHGFWPTGLDQYGVIYSLNRPAPLAEEYSYSEAHKLVQRAILGGR